MSYTEYLRTLASRRQNIVDTRVRGDASTAVMRKRIAVSNVFAVDGGSTGTLLGRPERSYPAELGYDHPAIASKKQLGRPPPASAFTAYQGSKSGGSVPVNYGGVRVRVPSSCGGCEIPFVTTLGSGNNCIIGKNTGYKATDASVSAGAITAQRAQNANQYFNGPPKLVNLLTRPKSRNTYSGIDSCCNENIDYRKGGKDPTFTYRHPDAVGTPNYVPPNYGNNIASNTNYKSGGAYNPRSKYVENHHGSTIHRFDLPIPYDPVSGASGPPHLRLNQPPFPPKV